MPRWYRTDTTDILAHTLWAGAGMVALGRRVPIAPRTIAAGMALAALPDLLHLLPIVGWWWFGNGAAAAMLAHAFPVPGELPPLPPLVAAWSYHLHCTMHSVFVVGAVTLLLWALTRSLWLPLLGWWLHLAIDVPTHSAEFFPTPILYPFSERGFDGLAWNTPWFMVVNYAALAAVAVWLWRRRRMHRG